MPRSRKHSLASTCVDLAPRVTKLLLHADIRPPCCQDLRELGVAALGPRRRLMAAAAAGAAAVSAQGHIKCTPRPGSAGAGKLHPVMVAARRGAGAATSPARRASQNCKSGLYRTPHTNSFCTEMGCVECHDIKVIHEWPAEVSGPQGPVLVQ